LSGQWETPAKAYKEHFASPEVIVMNLVRLLLYPRWRLSAQIRNVWIVIGYYYIKARAVRLGRGLMNLNPKLQAYHVINDETGDMVEEEHR
jgi:hypothetical protein